METCFSFTGWWLVFTPGYYLAQTKPNARECKRSLYQIAWIYFLLSKKPKYYYDHEAIKEDAIGKNPGNKKPHKHQDQPFSRTKANLTKIGPVSKKNKRSVWVVAPKKFKGAHFATFPKDLIEPCVLAGCPEGGTVLDPFGGSGTTGIVAAQHKRNAVLLELNQEYIDLAKDRINLEVKNEMF